MMNVLIGCEVSGTVRDAFRRRGHRAVSCDINRTWKKGPHRIGSVLDILDEGWDLLIVHPPCTYLCSSGLHWNRRVPGRAKKTKAALRFVEQLLNAPIPRIALENPIGCISTQIRKYDQLIQPYQFGHDASKATCLWLTNLPLLKPTKFVEPRYVCCGSAFPYSLGKFGCPKCCGERTAKPRWANQTDSGQNRLGPSPTRSIERAVTYQGIADAMAEQWGVL